MSSIDRREFRDALSGFATGITIGTTPTADGAPVVESPEVLAHRPPPSPIAAELRVMA
jgi:hypothetical protein